MSNVTIHIEDLDSKGEDGKTIFELLIDKNATIKPGELLEHITNNYDYLVYMINHNYYPEKYYNYDLLFDSSKGTPIINLIYEKNANKLKALPLKVIKHLFEEVNGRFPIDDLLDINVYSCDDIVKRINNFELLRNYLVKSKNPNAINVIMRANNNILLSKGSDNKTILENLIDNNVSSVDIFMNKDSSECAKIFYDKGKYYTLISFNIDILVNYPTKEHNYIDLLIEKYQSGEKIRFDLISINTSKKECSAKIILALAKNNIPYKKPSLSELFRYIGNEEKPIIVYMLEMNKELTIKNFIDDEVINEFRKYIGKRLSLTEEITNNLSLDELINYLPNPTKLLDDLKNGKVRIDDTDIYEDDFLKPFANEKSFLEYALKNKINIYPAYCPKTIYEIELFIKYNVALPRGIKESLLYEKINDNELVIDLLMQNNRISTIKGIVDKDLRIIDYCVKYNKFNILSQEILDELFASINNQYDAIKYLSNDSFIEALKKYDLSKNIAQNMLENGYLKALQHASERILLTNYNNKTVLEHLLDNNITPSFSGYDFKDKKTMMILYKYRKPELMWNGKLELIVNYPTKENNYLKYMIAAYKKGINVSFEWKNFFVGKAEDTARAYLQMAKSGLVEMMNTLDSDNLLYEHNGDKSVLYYLINIDRDTAINKVLNKLLLKDPKINAALKVLSQDGLINLPIAKLNCSEICRDALNKEYAEGIESPVEDLLKELRDVFLQDGLSDPSLIEALVTSYRYTTSKDPMFIEELKLLINIKKNNPKFHYKLEDGGAYFNSFDQVVVCNSTTISTLNHETGHALHFYTTNEAIPDNFFELIEEVRNSPGWLKKVDDYSHKFSDMRKKIHERAVDIVEKAFSADLSVEDNEEILKLLGEEKESIIERYVKKGYKKEDLDVILSSTYTKEEFLKQKKQIEIFEVEDFLMRHIYDAFTAIGDFIDAISNGNYRSKVLLNDEGKLIPSAYGHGIRYYQTKELKYCEMIANYTEIMKSKHANEIIKVLRDIIGDDLVDMLDNFYKKEMLKLDTYEINDGNKRR